MKQSPLTISLQLRTSSGAQRRIVLSRGGVVFAIVFMSILFVGFLGGTVMFLHTNDQLGQANKKLSEVIVNAERMHADVARIAGAAYELDAMLGGGSPVDSDGSASLLAALPVRFERSGSTAVSQAPDAATDTAYIERILKSAQLSFAGISDTLDSQNGFLSDIPSIWPLQNNHGHVTLEFGPNRHPKTNQWYLHKGIDIAGVYGVEVLASASGKVIEAGYGRTGYGNYVLIRHKYGFRTRYSHLSRIRVSEGQDVVQGEAIGTLGNTGISTGPHLDFQIILGTDVIDPAQFLKISRQQFQRWAGNR